MRKTYTEAKMKFIDVTAKQNSSPDSYNGSEFSDISMLERNREQDKVAMLDLNGFPLDGESTTLEDEDTIPFWSRSCSGAECTFEANPILWVDFFDTHTSAGITLDFFGDYPAEIKVTWYGSSGAIVSKTFYPDALSYFCKQQVTNYVNITIEFVKTRLPYQYVKLSNIEYGMTLKWAQSKIKTAKVLEEVNVLSTELSINTASIDILDEKNDFDSGNENGIWKSVQKTQEITLTEYIDDEPVPMGTFYIDDKSFSGNIASFTMIDAIGLMDNYTYYNGRIYNKVKARIILEDIFFVAKISKYEISEEIGDIELSGWIGIQSCREALQMICCMTGAVADDSRSDTIKVYPASRSVSSTITPARKFTGKTSISLDTYVSGVQLECAKYDLESEVSEIFSDFLEAGEQTITFSEPYDPTTLTATGCYLIEKETNYVVVSVSQSQDCVISGKRYAETVWNFQKAQKPDAGEADNIVKLGTFTIYNASLLPTIAKNMYEYYALRKVVDIEYIVETEHSGNWVTITDTNRNQATSLIESQSIDLTGGFLSVSKCRGYSTVVTEMYYTGNELYSGDNFLI
jgi:hypothetical protein